MPDEGNHFGPTFLPRMNRSLQTFLTATPVLTLRQPNEALNKKHLAAHARNPRAEEAETGGICVQDQPGLHTKPLRPCLRKPRQSTLQDKLKFCLQKWPWGALFCDKGHWTRISVIPEPQLTKKEPCPK